MSSQIEIINHSKQKVVSSVFLKNWVHQVIKELKKRRIINHLASMHLTIAFVTEEEMQKLNRTFRSQNKPTDILSFHSENKGEWGELALCPKYIHKQWVKSSGSLRESTAYLVVHGMLHLLGFEHEKSRVKAKEMYDLQDSIFFTLQPDGFKK